jgi:hypothetical protein
MGLSNDVGAAELGGVQRVTVRLLPDGRLSAVDAAKYLGRDPQTLAQWRNKKIGPVWTKMGRSVWYHSRELDRFIREGFKEEE